ncbi:RHS repeat-associated core domain-containing protein [Actinomadura terrae]|uniref:RHS repeat-associated core domain-containing protein n=1 Tax=Actinomadura terrae TaxID=604353 RepID=UPI003556867E
MFSRDRVAERGHPQARAVPPQRRRLQQPAARRRRPDRDDLARLAVPAGPGRAAAQRRRRQSHQPDRRGHHHPVAGLQSGESDHLIGVRLRRRRQPDLLPDRDPDDPQRRHQPPRLHRRPDRPATNNLYLSHRHYAPGQGSFTQQDTFPRLTDPIHGNLYAYASDNPVNYTDPTGRFSLGKALGAASACISGAFTAATAAAPYTPLGAAAGGVGEGVVLLGAAGFGRGIGVTGSLTVGVNPLG